MAIGLGTTFASPTSISLAPSTPHCQICQTMEGIHCSMMPSSGPSVTVWNRPAPSDARRPSDTLTSISFRWRNPLFGAVQPHWLPTGQDPCLSNVWVAADYSDSVPDSSNYMGNRGYHPLEELKVYERSRETMLSSAEIARTTVEANSSALLVFPGMVHCEPHRHISWAEFQYVTDDYGDIFFEIFDDENILQDRGASNPVNVLIGMDMPMHASGRKAGNYNKISAGETTVDIPFDNNLFEVMDPEVSDTLVDWGMPDRLVHPMYFAKCLTKATNTKYGKMMEHPSNTVSIVGCLRPAFIDEESYLRRLIHNDDSDGYSDWKDDSEREEEQLTRSYRSIDGEILNLNSKYDGDNQSSTLYKLEIMKIELFSVYGVQSAISLQDFEEAESDVLVHSASAIIERFNEKRMKCNVALKALCRKKGLNVEGAKLIGVDSLGIDVRVFSGVEAQTLRFPFKARAKSDSAAEKTIQRMLFPRYHRKKFKMDSDGHGDEDSF